MSNDMRNLIHVLLVAFIILLLMSIVVDRGVGPRYPHVTAAKTDIANFETAINRFRADCGYYPRSTHLGIQSPGFKGTEGTGTDVLIKRPAGMPESVWRGPYLDARRPLNDPWGRPYVYECPGKQNPDSFDIYSLGPNGKGGDEAIRNWTGP